MTIVVVSKRAGGNKGKDIDVIIDISRTSPVGNPYPVGKHGRDACIQKFLDSWPILMKDSVFANYIQRIINLHMEGKTVGIECWCSPEACHGDIIKCKVEEMCNARREALSGIPFGESIADHLP